MTKDETWDGLREFPVKGNYFELLETAAAVDVVAFDAEGNPLNVENAVEQGFWIDRRGQVPFSRLNITTTGSTRVKFLVTDGTAGNRAVPADITSDAARLLGIVYGSLGQLAQQLLGGVNAAVVTERGFEYGASYKSTTAKLALTADEVFAFGANTAGAIVWSATFRSNNNAAARQRAAYIAHTAAPTLMSQGDHIVGAKPTDQNNVAGVAYGELLRPVYIPAGKGFYFLPEAAEAAADVQRAVLYTLLT